MERCVLRWGDRLISCSKARSAELLWTQPNLHRSSEVQHDHAAEAVAICVVPRALPSNASCQGTKHRRANASITPTDSRDRFVPPVLPPLFQQDIFVARDRSLGNTESSSLRLSRRGSPHRLDFSNGRPSGETIAMPIGAWAETWHEIWPLIVTSSLGNEGRGAIVRLRAWEVARALKARLDPGRRHRRRFKAEEASKRRPRPISRASVRSSGPVGFIADFSEQARGAPGAPRIRGGGSDEPVRLPPARMAGGV